MSGEFLNGIETQRSVTGTPPVAGAETAVTLLVGTAPIFAVAEENRKVNQIGMVTTYEDGVKQFGPRYADYSIPTALKVFYNQSGGKVFVVNVFDPEKHKSSFSNTLNINDGKIKLQHRGIMNLSVKNGEETLEPDTDYTFDGETITAVKDNKMAALASVLVSYDFADVSKVTVADIVGTVDVDGVRTGLELAYNVRAEYGIKPTIIIAPCFSSSETVTNAIDIVSDKLKAVGYADAPLNATKTDVIKGRAENGELNLNSRSKRLVFLYPGVKVYNETEDITEVFPLSALKAGLRTRIDRDYGVHYSDSNQALKGVEGMETPISFEISDFDSDTNLLNSKGITTLANINGEIKLWGNHNASFPDNVNIDSFECTIRTADYIENAITQATIGVMAQPINQSLIDDLVNMVKNFLALLKTKGMIIAGDSWYDASLNPSTELVQGKLTICYEFLPPAPFEHGIYKSQINIDLYNTIGGNA